jgi:hypothetical protein
MSNYTKRLRGPICAALASVAILTEACTTSTSDTSSALGTGIAVYFLATGVNGLQLLGAENYVQQLFYAPHWWPRWCCHPSCAAGERGGDP